MGRDELVRALRALHGSSDEEVAHMEADELLLRFIDDREVREAFEAIVKWYA